MWLTALGFFFLLVLLACVLFLSVAVSITAEAADAAASAAAAESSREIPYSLWTHDNLAGLPIDSSGNMVYPYMNKHGF